MSLGAGLSRAGLARPKHGQQSTGKPWTAGSGLRKALPPVSVPELPWTAGRGGRSAVRGDAEDGGGGRWWRRCRLQTGARETEFVRCWGWLAVRLLQGAHTAQTSGRGHQARSAR